MRFSADAAANHSELSLVRFGAGADGRVLVSAPIAHLQQDLASTHPPLSLEALVSVGELHADEAALARALPETRRGAFVAGRRALRAAIRAVAPDRVDVPLLLARPLLRTTRGAPTLPLGVRGSISHKRSLAVALAEAGASGHLGVDLEERTPMSALLRASPDRTAHLDVHRHSLASRILTLREQDALAVEIEASVADFPSGGLTSSDADAARFLRHASAHDADVQNAIVRDAVTRDATLLRFALKEAAYKAIDPVVQRYVRFTEVEVDIHAPGEATVHLLLPELGANDATLEASWQMDERWIIAAVRAEFG